MPALLLECCLSQSMLTHTHMRWRLQTPMPDCPAAGQAVPGCSAASDHTKPMFFCCCWQYTVHRHVVSAAPAPLPGLHSSCVQPDACSHLPHEHRLGVAPLRSSPQALVGRCAKGSRLEADARWHLAQFLDELHQLSMAQALRARPCISTSAEHCTGTASKTMPQHIMQEDGSRSACNHQHHSCHEPEGGNPG